MENFISLEKTVPPVALEVPDGFLVHQLTEDCYLVAKSDVPVGMKAIQQDLTDTLADRAARRQLEIEESINPIISMFWTEFE